MESKNTMKNIIMGGIKLLFLISLFSFLNVKNTSRNVHLAGLVLDASTLEPVKSANIYSSDGELLGKTNNNGYYDVNFEVNPYGQIEFTLKIEKDKYKTFIDKERWGDLHNVNLILYFGISKLNSEVTAFSRFSNDKNQGGNLNYERVIKGLESIKIQKDFADQISELKKGNENSFFKISENLYIVSNTGWIKIKSDTDHVSINNKKVVLANQLNSLIKRSDINGMTPVDSKDAMFLIHTK